MAHRQFPFLRPAARGKPACGVWPGRRSCAQGLARPGVRAVGHDVLQREPKSGGAALHDIPGRYRLADGDLLSVGCGATLDGWAADAAISVQVGHHHPADTRLISTTTRALQAGIAAAVPGGRLGDISAAIGAACRAAGGPRVLTASA